ncbi:KOW domain-containing RNA-binding protein [Peptoniphilaceae bacterium SGI.131]
MRFNEDKKCNLVVGQIAASKAGRDKGEVFIVYEIVDDEYVLVVDGKVRKIDKPKKKKIKHLQKHNHVIEDFESMKERYDFNDAFVRKLILDKH